MLAEERGFGPHAGPNLVGWLQAHAGALQCKGFLTIEVDEHDRRARRLTTTTRHRRFWARRNPNDFALIEAWTVGLAGEEVEQMVRLLRKLIAGMPRAAGPGQSG